MAASPSLGRASSLDAYSAHYAVISHWFCLQAALAAEQAALASAQSKLETERAEVVHMQRMVKADKQALTEGWTRLDVTISDIEKRETEVGAIQAELGLLLKPLA